MKTSSETSLAENIVNYQGEISFRSIITKMYMRPKLFLICALFPPILALIFASLVPTDWRASTKILIRYSSTESPFLKGLIPDNRLLLSGSSSAELLKSTPTIEIMVNKVGVKDSDVYQKPMSVITNYFSQLLKPEETNQSTSESNTTQIARTIKDSLEGSSSSSSKSRPVEILEKNSQVPDTMKGDELLSLEVRSFNREKVADMANGLANAFIDEYYRLSAEDAHKSYLFLSELVEKAEQDVQDIENTDDSKVESSTTALTSVLEQTRRESPLLGNMSRQLTDLESSLMQAEQTYMKSSPKVVRLRSEIGRLKQAIKKEERLDTSKQVLEQLKVRKYQAYNTENLYKNRLIPISIVEPAVMPKPSVSKVVVKYMVSGVVGLLLGIILGISLIAFLNITDPRLTLRDDIKKITNIPIFGTLQYNRQRYGINKPFKQLDLIPQVENGLVQIFGYTTVARQKNLANTIVLASPSEGDGVSFVSLALSFALAKNSPKRMLLIDANLKNQTLSKHFNLEQSLGLTDALLNNQSLLSYIVPLDRRNIHFVPTGDFSRQNGCRGFNENLSQILEEAQQQYDVIIVDTGAVLTSNEIGMFSPVADSCILVVSAAISRKGSLNGALQKLDEIGVVVNGIVLNKYKLLLPKFIYQNI